MTLKKSQSSDPEADTLVLGLVSHEDLTTPEQTLVGRFVALCEKKLLDAQEGFEEDK